MSLSADFQKSWFSPRRFALLAACIIAACFAPVIAGRETFFFRDFAIFSYPLAAYHKECFWRGEIPLWNPYNDCGVPFLAQWNTMVFYPLSLIYLLLPLSWSLSFFCLLHFFFAALGMYWLARRWTGSDFAGAVAGFSFVFGGVLLSCLKWPNNIAALAWMPWIILCLDLSFTDRWSRAGLAAFAGAAQMLAGAPEVILLTWIFAGALLVSEVIARRGERVRIVMRFAIVIALVAALSAVQLLPFLDLLRHSQRDSGFAGSQWPMPIWGWLNFLVPVFRTFPSYHDVQAQPGQYWISTYYTSIAALLLAFVTLVRARHRRVWLLWILFIAAIWLALGNRGGLYKLARATVPGLGMMRFPIKFVVLAAFCVPLLAAHGAASLSNENRSRRSIWIIAAALAAIVAGVILYSELNPFRYSTAFLTTRNGLWRVFFLFASAGCIEAILKRQSHSAALVLVILLVADGLTHTTWENPTAPRWVYSGTIAEMKPRPELGQDRAMISPEAAERVDHLKIDSPAEDVLASRASQYCNVNLLDEIPKVDGFYALYPRESADLQDRLYASTNLPPAPLLNFLGVTQLTKSNSWQVWIHRTNALPLITSPVRARMAAHPLDEIFRDTFNPRDEAVFDPQTHLATNEFTPAEFTAVRWETHRISFVAKSRGPALAVIAQTFWHCWNAAIDGQATPILRANHGFQALEIPAGKHQIEMVYRDNAFRAGALISFIAAAVLTILFLLENRRRQRT